MVLTRGRTYFEVPGRQRTHPSQELIAANTELLLRRGDYITPHTYTTRIYQLGTSEHRQGWSREATEPLLTIKNNLNPERSERVPEATATH